MKRNYLLKECSAFSVNINENIQTAIDIINKGGIQICLVFCNKNKLRGIITDSDLRRSILNGISPNSKF